MAEISVSIEASDLQNSVTIYDIAREAGTSIATVSRVINHPGKVSEKTRNRILQIMENKNFIPRVEARERARKEVGRIGVITPYFTHPSFVHRLRGISEALRGDSFELVIINLETHEEIETYLRTPGLFHRIDGLIILSRKFANPTLEILKEQLIPAVFVEFGEDDFSSVCIDNKKGGRIAASFLLEKGYKNFAVLTEDEPSIDVHPNVMRVSGFRERLEEVNLILEEQNVIYSSSSMAETIKSLEFFLESRQPDAFFATTDLLAVSVLKAAREKNIKIPEEMALIGFDGTNTSDYIDLTTVDQSLEESGKLAVELLMKRIKDPESPVQTIILPLKVIERETS
jgi:LacI family transcriptional regulator